MKNFVILLKNKRRGELNSELLYAHIEHLKELDEKKILRLCGPFTDNDGAIKIIDANDLEEAIYYARQDPFTREGYYQDYEVYEFIEANAGNHYLLDDAQTKSNQK